MKHKFNPRLVLILTGLFLFALLVTEGISAEKPVKKEITKLNPPLLSGKMSLEESIKNRRSQREFLPTELSKDQISQLLWAAQGITDKGWNLRAAPSAGSLYPLQIYIVKGDGIYHYLPQDNAIEKISDEDRRTSLAQACLGQSFVAEAPVSIIVGADFYKVRPKYGSRTERYIFLEAGHVVENIQLQAVAMGLGSIPVGAFWDDIVKRMLLLPTEIYPVYIIPVGYIR
ncbi:MAG: SagB/ThcOx family dehydrogenase [Candidatus Saganbacteria bacterium]|nr:SagB/ThcOx family dehydrogenase [Candidatus Saganbacteria bacterium]